MIATDPAQQTIQFINCLTHPTTGTSFELRDWQEQIIRKLMETDADGRRQHTHCGIWLPRANGKTELAAALILERFLRDKRPRRQFYCAASTRDQARFLFNKVEAMVSDNPKLRKHVTLKTSTHTIINNETGSTFKAVASEAGAMHGSEPTMVVYDEIHGAKDRELYTSFVTGMGKVDQPLMVTITTAGISDKTTLEWEQYDYACKVRDGIIDDSSYLPIIYAANKDADWLDEKVWYRVNPALGDFRSSDEMQKLALKSKQVTALQNDFRRLYLNQHTEQYGKWLSTDHWDACQVESIDINGQWFGGADLSAKIDLTAFSLMRRNENGYSVKTWQWIPEDTAERRSKEDRVPYPDWKSQGFLEYTPGNRVDQEYVCRRIQEICEQHGCRTIAFDAHNAEWFFQELQKEGYEVIESPQNVRVFNEPCKEFESLLSAGDLEHEANECTRWQVSNVEIKTSGDGMIKPVKGLERGRIDVVVAMLLSLDVAMQGTDTHVPYETGSLLE